MRTLFITTLSLALALIVLQRCTTASGRQNESHLDKMRMRRDSALKLLKPVESNENLTITTQEDLIGSWTGYLSFADTSLKEEYLFDNGDMISIHVDSIRQNQAFAHSVFLGKTEPLIGSFEELSGVFFFQLKHTQKGRLNGQFQLSIPKSKDEMFGVWEPSNQHIDAFDGKFSLKKRIFKYDPANQTLDEALYVDWSKYKIDSIYIESKDVEEGFTFEEESYLSTTERVYEKNASAEELTKEFVENLTKADIFILRNSIYARHGYAFEYPSLTAFFGQFDWYVPLSNDITGSLTDLELKNLEILLRYEAYAEEYYDVFGR